MSINNRLMATGNSRAREGNSDRHRDLPQLLLRIELTSRKQHKDKIVPQIKTEPDSNKGIHSIVNKMPVTGAVNAPNSIAAVRQDQVEGVVEVVEGDAKKNHNLLPDRGEMV